MTAAPLKTPAISAAREFQELPAWQKSLTLAEQVYAKTERFPLREHVGLAAAMRQSAQAIPSHIASASGKTNDHGINESYSAAQQSLGALFTQATLATRLGHLSTEDAITMLEDIEEVERLIIGLRHGLKVQAKEDARVEREVAQRDREIEMKAKREERSERGDRPFRKEGEFRSRDSGERPARREYKPRDGGDERPRREYKPRDGAGDERPRREYKPRDGAGDERPRREYKPRDGGSGGYGDKKPYGAKKPYGGGDKKPFRKGPPRNRD